MKKYILSHKKWFLIGLIVLVCIAFSAALFCDWRLNKGAAEAVPEGRVHDSGVFGDDVTQKVKLSLAILMRMYRLLGI